MDVPPLSMKETRKNVRAVFKEDDVDSILQSYQKPQITPTAIGNVLPLVQDKTKPPAKTVPSSSVNKSHRSLPRRACLVYLHEQYRLDSGVASLDLMLGHTFYNRPCLVTGMLVHTYLYIWLLSKKCTA